MSHQRTYENALRVVSSSYQEVTEYIRVIKQCCENYGMLSQILCVTGNKEELMGFKECDLERSRGGVHKCEI